MKHTTTIIDPLRALIASLMSEMSPRDGQSREGDAADGITATFDWSSTAPSTGAIETLAIALDCQPTAMEPLYETVDPNALDTVVLATCSEPVDTPTTVTFVHAGKDVTVYGDGTVAVRSVDAPSEVA